MPPRPDKSVCLHELRRHGNYLHPAAPATIDDRIHCRDHRRSDKTDSSSDSRILIKRSNVPLKAVLFFFSFFLFFFTPSVAAHARISLFWAEKTYTHTTPAKPAFSEPVTSLLSVLWILTSVLHMLVSPRLPPLPPPAT